MFEGSLQGSLTARGVFWSKWDVKADGVGLITCVFLLVVHAPTLFLGGNRFGFLAPTIVVILVLLILRAQKLDPPQIASWLWLTVIAWGGVQISLGLTPDPGEGAQVLVRFALYAAIFLLGASIARSSRRAVFVVRATAIWIGAVSVYGLAAWATGLNPILAELEAYPSALEASFVNRNAFALYAAFGMFAALTSLRISGADLSALVKGAWIWPAIATICAAALILTGSRGGVGASTIGLCVFIACSRGGKAALSLCLALVIGVAFSASFLRDTGIFADPRFDVHGQVATAILDAPLFGHGIGGFQDGFRPVLAGEWRWGDWDHAHQQYLETAFEMGVPAAAMMLSAIFLVAPWSRPTGTFAPLAMAALIAAAVHAFVDFSLTIPSVALTLALFLGLARGRE